MKRIGIIFGGRSLEHEISVLSASSVIDAIDRSKYEVVPIGINKRGDWFLIKSNMNSILDLEDERIATLIPSTVVGYDCADGGGEYAKEASERAIAMRSSDLVDLVDFAMPILHGPYGEDGTIQGLFEMLNIPYAGCGVASSAVAMDKIFAKELMAKAGIPTCKYCAAYAFELNTYREREVALIENTLGYPMIVKPANMGSSVGITKAENTEELNAAIDEALKHDDRLLIETYLTARELEIAVVGNDRLFTGAVGEIIPGGEFYDYENKYQGAGTVLEIPAVIMPEVEDQIEELATKFYKILGATGFSRVDFFLEKGTDKLYLNEINTIPGFTAFSVFPLLCKEKGLEYAELIERIIYLGYERHNAKNNR